MSDFRPILRTTSKYKPDPLNSQYGQLKVSSLHFSSIRVLIVARYEYVKAFEQPDILLPNTWIVVRIDGRGFHKYATCLSSFLELRVGCQADVNKVLAKA